MLRLSVKPKRPTIQRLGGSKESLKRRPKWKFDTFEPKSLYGKRSTKNIAYNVRHVARFAPTASYGFAKSARILAVNWKFGLWTVTERILKSGKPGLLTRCL